MSDEVIDRPAAGAEPWSRFDGSGDEPDCRVDRCREVTPPGQPGGDRRGQGATGAVCVARDDAWPSPDVLLDAVPQEVDRVTFQMPPLHQYGSRAEIRDHASRIPHLVEGSDRMPRKDGGFLQVGCYERRERKEETTERLHCVGLKQSISTRRDHHGVHHEPVQLGLSDRARHLDDQGLGREHARLDGGGSQIVDDREDLSTDLIRRQRMDRSNPDGVLGRDCGDRARAVDPERVEGLQVRLDAGSTSGVTARDRQRDRNRSFVHTERRSLPAWN